MPITEEQEIRIRCMELAMKTVLAIESPAGQKVSELADFIYEWVMRSKPEESKPKES